MVFVPVAVKTLHSGSNVAAELADEGFCPVEADHVEAAAAQRHPNADLHVRLDFTHLSKSGEAVLALEFALAVDHFQDPAELLRKLLGASVRQLVYAGQDGKNAVVYGDQGFEAIRPEIVLLCRDLVQEL